MSEPRKGLPNGSVIVIVLVALIVAVEGIFYAVAWPFGGDAVEALKVAAAMLVVPGAIVLGAWRTARGEAAGFGRR